MAKVHIIGAGPSGCIAAISAARAGHNVVVSEEHERSGIPTNCSGLFSKDGLDQMQDLVNYKKFVLNDLWGASIHFFDEQLVIRSKTVMGYSCDRAAFDQELASNAVLEGVKINYRERISSASSFKSQNIIGADGPNSFVSKAFGMGDIRKFACTMQATIGYKSEDKHMVEVFLSRSNFPGFFGWIIPHNEETAELGVGVELPNNVQNAWDALLKIKKVKSSVTVLSKPTASIIPLEVREKTANREGNTNILLVGDAAGQVKATTGGGVIFGGLCARLAGAHATNPLRYDIEWHARYGPDLMIHHMIRQYLNWMSDSRLKAFGKRLRSMHLDEYLSKNGSMDRPSRMIKPQIILHILKNIVGED